MVFVQVDGRDLVVKQLGFEVAQREMGNYKENVLDFFPGKTASELDVEIMNNKYVLSKEKSKGVGIIDAARNCAKKLGQEPPLAAFWNGIARKVREILRMD